ncbi:P-loop containing nucleoside triphosphate hydrolase protein [Leptodontidium sp. 2 PMI_412]|nr:P-loop containing nucleoside triphosphate hydrolase protein [Leptodontidium sp. 2 PMI_412]
MAKETKQRLALPRTEAGPSRPSIASGPPGARVVGDLVNWVLITFWATEMDIVMVGLENSGKTSLLRVLSGGEFSIDSIPTVGFNMKKIQKGHVTLRCWDLGGQPRFRSMCARYSRGCHATVFVVDAEDPELVPVAKEGLHLLIRQPPVQGIPLLVLGTFTDISKDHLSVDEMIEALSLKDINGREVSMYGIGVKEETNLDEVIQWLISRAKR